MDVFWDVKNLEKEDLANEIGYSTLGIVLSVENTKLHEIIDKKEFFANPKFLERLVENILNEYREVNSIFDVFLKHPGNKTRYENNSATNFQVMSYFATLWTLKYEIDIYCKEISIKERYRNSYNKAQKNFIIYYINDIAINKWAGTGDKTLGDIYMRRSIRYLSPIDKITLETRLLDWYSEILERASINLNNVSKAIFTVYSSFYRNKLLSSEYDFEHVVSRNKVRNDYQVHKIPAGSLGNLMFLDLSYNRSKKQDNLYQSLREGQRLDGNYIEIVEYPTEGIMGQIETDILNGKFDTTKKMIEARGKSIITNLVNKLYNQF